MSLKKRLLIYFFLYSVDVCIAMLGFTLAFGLTVHSWAALILLPLISRFVFHVATTLVMAAEAAQRRADQ